jgi:hypothetical protein
LQPGTNALRSQERDLTPVIIRPTEIAPVQSSTADATTSGGLSKGRGSRMWWQSREGQREKLLDAVSA